MRSGEPDGARRVPPGGSFKPCGRGTSGVAEIAENKFYVARSAFHERDGNASSMSGRVERTLLFRTASACPERGRRISLAHDHEQAGGSPPDWKTPLLQTRCCHNRGQAPRDP